MADRAQCEAALHALASRLDEIARNGNRLKAPDRVVVCRIPDLQLTYSGRLRDGCLEDIGEGEAPDPQIVFTVDSDDLVALVEGRLPVTAAWASGRLKVDASMRDLLRVRSVAAR